MHTPPCASVLWPGECVFHKAKINITITSKDHINLLTSLATFLVGGNMTTSKNGDCTKTTLHTILYNGPSVSRAVKNFVHYVNVALRAECSLNHHQATTVEEEDSKSLGRTFGANMPKGAIHIQKIHVRVTRAWLAYLQCCYCLPCYFF